MQEYQEEFSTAGLGFPVTLITRLDGGPIRPVLNGRRSRPVWNYYSMKCGVGFPCESANELHALYHSEVSSAVVRYRVQPHTLRFVIGGRIVSYTPDLEEVLADGGVRTSEVKDKFKADEDPEYTQKLGHAAAFYAAKGQQFRILEREQIEARPLFASVDIIQSFRRTAVTIEDVNRLFTQFAGRDAITLAEARALFASGPVGFAKLSAMMVRRIISFDLTRGISADTPIYMLRHMRSRLVA